MTPHPTPLTLDHFEARLGELTAAPRDHGRLDLIVRRPAVATREVLVEGDLDPEHGLLGDTWTTRGSSRTADGARHPDLQLTLMNSRVIAMLAQSRDRWPLAGDQLYVDLDLSTASLPAGTRLAIGTAEIEVTAQPHTGCGKFVERFGVDAMKFVNSPRGRALCLRGIYARVVRPGRVRAGDVVTRVAQVDR